MSTKTITKTITKTKKTVKPITPAAMRVSIAKDVLARIEEKTLVPTIGTWVEDKKLGEITDFVDKKVDWYGDDPRHSQKLPLKEYACGITKCNACALGAIFVSSVCMYGGETQLPASKFNHDQIFLNLRSSPLSTYFSVGQLKLIERCFEGAGAMHSTQGNNSMLGERYADIFKNNKVRLTAIMTNIIRNNGMFEPQQDLAQAMVKEGKSK